ncbi:choice-of-anchor D domain-containing protein [Embleya sp. NBC_00888]|uniref:choice-of-anchor D domain-containing protein n=1 Tax=Embleya sp. NBC_00888 TaxID=2975960 RepID=UPI00386AE237|nr:choice-of-anchor D domain-containing protein [Embleya sp. NBC_00888]
MALGRWMRRGIFAAMSSAVLLVGSGASAAPAEDPPPRLTWTARSDRVQSLSVQEAWAPVSFALPDRPGTLTVRLVVRGGQFVPQPGQPTPPRDPDLSVEASVPVGPGTALRPGEQLVLIARPFRVMLGPASTGDAPWVDVDNRAEQHISERVFPGTKVRTGRFTGPAAEFTYSSRGPGELTVSPGMDFGEHRIGGGWRWLPVRVRNTGESDLTLREFGLPPGDFTIHETATTCHRGNTLAAGASCDVAVMFRPGAIGPRSAALTVTTDAPGGPRSVALTGTGGAGAPTGKPDPPTAASAAPPGPTESPTPPPGTDAPPTTDDHPTTAHTSTGTHPADFLLTWVLPITTGAAIALWIRHHLRRRHHTP